MLLVIVSVTFAREGGWVRACFSSLGLAITAIIPNADAGPAIVNAIVFPLLFVSNVFIPNARPPAVLRTITGIFPGPPPCR